LRRTRWSPAAADDLEIIRNYLREHHPSFLQSTVGAVYNAARSLKQMPQRGRVGQTPGTRKLVLAPLPYIMVYGVEPDMAHVLRILHAAKDR